MKKVATFQGILCTTNGLSTLRDSLIGDQTPIGEALMIFMARAELLIGREKQGFERKLQTVMSLEIAKISSRFEKGSDFLATTAGVAPFVGLFGTVWGIMRSFQAIGTLNSVALTVVAPSIGEALLATAVGLFVAIPALIFYNYTSARTAQITQDLENLMWEIITTLDAENED
ncbi:MotA/TolQ/ExbB proton channel family protein [Neorickettsia helminthoeca]|nr:MotA/TolQ/ExbB proton channel family protein [Neorickettsia helminthoeca]